MKKIFMLLFLFVVSCAPAREQEFGASEKTKAEMEDLQFDGEPDNPKDRIDVYESMARAIRYNIATISQATTDKIFSNTSPKGVLQGIENVVSEEDSPLFTGMKLLDYALLHAVASISNDSRYVGEVIYKKSAENLSLATIKAHKGALFAYKENKSLKKMINDENKNLKSINTRLEKKGSLTPDELEYKKGIEVGLIKMAAIHAAFVDDVATYSKLIHAKNADKLRLEGRKFYELEDFDKRYSMEIFQRSAVRNRRELQVTSEFAGDYGFEEIENKLFRKYPEVERLRINGYDIKSALYIQSLQKRASKVANDLVDATIKYLSTTNELEKREAKRKVMDEIAVAVFTQVELSYNLVQQTDYELLGINAQIKDIKRVQNEFKKRFRLTNEQKVDFMDANIKEGDLELRKSQMMAERALAIRATYFYAGLDPFTRNLVKSDIRDIAASLKQSFNTDMVTMLAEIPDEEVKKAPIKNEWAQEDNWLETVINAPKENKKIINMPDKPRGLFDPYVGAQFDKLQNMQLGSYNIRKSADVEWSYLKDLYPEFKNYTPAIEEVVVDGQKFYRMILKSEKGGWVELCNKLRRDRVECILR